MGRESRNRQKRRKADVKSDRQRAAKTILKRLGLWELIEGTTVVQKFLAAHYPRIQIGLAESETRTRESTVIVRELARTARRMSFDFPLLGSFTIDDYFSGVKPLLDLLDGAISDDKTLQARLHQAQQLIRPLASAEVAAQSMLALFSALDDVVIKYGRIDRRLYFLEPRHGRNEHDKWFVSFTLGSTPAATKQVNPGGGTRTAYRCGQPFTLRGIEWVEWPASVIGRSEPRSYPVYVQAHALDNLYGREARALFIESGEWLVHDYLWQSLRTPRGVVPLQSHSNKFLVEYWLNAHKLGYLVAHRLDDLVLIETFLFLTMSGTPEGNLLHERLRLTRSDREYLNLDNVRTFLFSDLQFDAELVQILSDCGCGHLFKILIDPRPERSIPGAADEMRRFLGLSAT